MAGQIQGSTIVGIAFETTYGTYVPPTRFFPIRSESLSEAWNHVNRRLLRGIVDSSGYVAGNHSVEGNITMELLPAVLPHFLYVSRNSIVKSGAGPYVYTCTPTHIGDSVLLTKPSLSITMMKAGVVFGFTGCVMSQLTITVEEGIPTMSIDIVGSQEATQTTPTPTFLATDLPFNAGQYNIQIPTASQIFAVESFTFTVNDNAEPQFRLSSNSGAQWVKFGEREATLEINRDFESRAEWDLFKALTSTTPKITLTNGASIVDITMPRAIRATYEIDGASDQGSPVMASVNYEASYDVTTSRAYQIVVTTAENIT
jgi:hypothetical protein